MYVLSSEADNNRITVEFVLAGAALMVPRNDPTSRELESQVRLVGCQGRRGGGLFPDF